MITVSIIFQIRINNESNNDVDHNDKNKSNNDNGNNDNHSINNNDNDNNNHPQQQ